MGVIGIVGFDFMNLDFGFGVVVVHRVELIVLPFIGLVLGLLF